MGMCPPDRERQHDQRDDRQQMDRAERSTRRMVCTQNDDAATSAIRATQIQPTASVAAFSARKSFGIRRFGFLPAGAASGASAAELLCCRFDLHGRLGRPGGRTVHGRRRTLCESRQRPELHMEHLLRSTAGRFCYNLCLHHHNPQTPGGHAIQREASQRYPGFPLLPGPNTGNSDVPSERQPEDAPARMRLRRKVTQQSRGQHRAATTVGAVVQLLRIRPLRGLPWGARHSCPALGGGCRRGRAPAKARPFAPR